MSTTDSSTVVVAASATTTRPGYTVGQWWPFFSKSRGGRTTSMLSKKSRSVLSGDGQWIISTIPTTVDSDDSYARRLLLSSADKIPLRSCLRRRGGGGVETEDASSSISGSSSYSSSSSSSSSSQVSFLVSPITSLSSEKDFQQTLQQQQPQPLVSRRTWRSHFPQQQPLGQQQPQQVQQQDAPKLKPGKRRSRKVRFHVKKGPNKNTLFYARGNTNYNNSVDDEELVLENEEEENAALWYSEHEVSLMMELYDHHPLMLQLLEELAVDDDNIIVQPCGGGDMNQPHEGIEKGEGILFLAID